MPLTACNHEHGDQRQWRCGCAAMRNALQVCKAAGSTRTLNGRLPRVLSLPIQMATDMSQVPAKLSNAAATTAARGRDAEAGTRRFVSGTSGLDEVCVPLADTALDETAAVCRMRSALIGTLPRHMLPPWRKRGCRRRSPVAAPSHHNSLCKRVGQFSWLTTSSCWAKSALVGAGRVGPSRPSFRRLAVVDSPGCRHCWHLPSKPQHSDSAAACI